MNHTPQIKKALQFAARKHHGQMRLEAEPLPYITHPVSVALLVAESHAHDDVVTAALLHDTLEDTATTLEEIIETFNSHVATLVDAVTEHTVVDGKKLEWRARKEEYLTRLKHISSDALLIAVADKVDNVESWNEGLEKEGSTFAAHWKQPHEQYVWFYGVALTTIEQRLREHPLTKRYRDAYQIFARFDASR